MRNYLVLKLKKFIIKVYKYRSGNKEDFKRDLAAIKNNTFFSANYSMFNDPFDIYFEENVSEFLNMLKQIFPNEDLDSFKREFMNVLNSKENTGIYCLSSDFLNEQMWAYYASSYSGYCIEYDLEKLVDKEQNSDFEFKLDISYEEIIPTINIDDIKNHDNLIRKIYGTKKLTWDHEDEIRLIFNKYGFKKFHPSAITGIYFAGKTPNLIKESFYEFFDDRDIKFYEIFPSKFKLDFKLIKETKRRLKYNINNFEFDILEHRMNPLHESFYIFYKDSMDESKIKEFILAFREAFCIKENSLYIFNNKQVKSLINVYPKNNEEYINYANSIITVSDDWEEAGINNPYKDFHYNEIIMNQ